MYKVLLADDEPYAIEGLELLIDWEKHGFQIETVCFNGEDAIEHIHRDPPDLVVTDIRMPVLDGLSLIEQTRRSGNRSTLFVIASGYSDFDYARQAMRLGVKHYLTKPIIGPEVDDLLQRLQHELSERERQRLVRDRADRYEARQALSVLLFGGEETDRREAARTLARLSGQASHWIYVHIGTDPQAAGEAGAAVLRMAEGEEGCFYLMDGIGSGFGLVYGSDQTGDREVRALIRRLHAALQAAVPGRVEMAVGCAVDRPDDLSKSYGSASEAKPFLFFGDDAIVHYTDIQGRTMAFEPETVKAADAIVEAVESGRPEELEASLREAFRTFEERMTLPELVGIFATQVRIRCASLCKELGGDPDELLTHTGYPDHAEPHRHAQQSAEALAAFCLRCQAVIQELRERQSGGIPAKVADFLRQNYMETFTIKEIAERFYINPVYLGQSFSRKYGLGIHDFVHDLRIEEAKRRLRDTNEASWAIAESVGYRGYQHFLKQFERRLGMRPSDYRLRSSS